MVFSSQIFRRKKWREYDLAKTGRVVSKTVELNEGPLDQFSHDMEPFIRKQGMPVKLKRAILMRLWCDRELVSDVLQFVKKVNVYHQRHLEFLRLLIIQMAAFRLHLKYVDGAQMVFMYIPRDVRYVGTRRRL